MMASRQAQWAAKRRAEGRCEICGGKRGKYALCDAHHKMKLEQQRKRYRRRIDSAAKSG